MTQQPLTALERIERISLWREWAEDEFRRALSAARAEGLTLEAIAGAARMTRQGVHKLTGPLGTKPA